MTGRVLSVLAGLIVLATIGFGAMGGFYVAYGLIVLSLLAGLGNLPRLIGQRHLDAASLCFLAALVLLAIAFTLTGDALHILNFTMFALYPLVHTALGRIRQAGAATSVSVLAAAACVIALPIAAYQILVVQMPRAQAFGSDPIWAAQAGVITAFLSLLALLRARKPAHIVLFAGAPILMLAAVVLSGSRGPMLALPFLFFIFLAAATRRWLLTLAGAAAFTLLALLVMYVAWPAGFERLGTIWTIVTELFGTGQIGEGSSNQRQLMYQAAIAAFLESPLYGHGWVNRMTAIGPYLAPDKQFFLEIHHHLHSDGFDFAVSGGVIGLLAYGFVLLAPIVGAIYSPDDSQKRFRLAAGVGLGVGYAIFGISYLTFGYEYHTTLYVCFTAVVLSYCRDWAPEPPRAGENG